MPRYLCVSDIHLNTSRRFEDTVAALRQVGEIVVRERIDKVLVLGDTFTSRRPHSKELMAFERWVTALPVTTKVVIIKGNHDEYASYDGEWGVVHSYHAFTELGIQSIEVFSQPHVYDGIFMGHMLLREAKIGPTDYQQSDAMTVEELLNKYPNCKAYVLGDVHKHQILRTAPLVMYSGSIEHVDFAERNDIKSVTMIEVLPGTTAYAAWPDSYVASDGSCVFWQTIALKTRPMLQYEVFPPYDVKLRDIDGAIVKVVVNGTSDDVRSFDEQRVRDSLSAAKELTISYEITNERRVRDDRFKEATSSADALNQYVSGLEISPEEKQKTIELGIEVMQTVNASEKSA